MPAAPIPRPVPARSLSDLWVALPAGVAVGYAVLPVAGLLLFALSSARVQPALRLPAAHDAVLLTAVTSTLVAGIAALVGTPLAYLLGRSEFRGRRLVEVVVEFPLVLPPVVAGVALLMTFGRRGLLGPALAAAGIEVPFTTAAVVLAQLFVAGPFYIASARVGFAAVPRELTEAASIDGASSWQQFRHVALPLATPALAGGAVLCWARAASEFGATLLFAGNLPGRTQTLSLAIMTALEADLDAAVALSVLLLALSAGALAGLRLLAASRTTLLW